MFYYDAVVIGGGFFGSRVALQLKRMRKEVLLLEKEEHLLKKASYSNQARVHGGYHYPRSLLTALRSRVNLPTFVEEYKECVVKDFDNYYAIGRNFSKVSAPQFLEFCRRIGAEIGEADDAVKNFFDENYVEDVFSVQEYAFDAVKLRKRLSVELINEGVNVATSAVAHSVEQTKKGVLVHHSIRGSSRQVIAKQVFNCTYSQINTLNYKSGLPIIPLKHELAEIALVEVPKELSKIGVTVMCGPFFSLMPFPAKGLHSLSHVRYTPRTEWQDGDSGWLEKHEAYNKLKIQTAYPKMLADAARYLPLAGKSKYVGSLMEIKTVLPQSEGDDSRPILFKANHGIDGYSCLMGGKLDNVYDVLKEIELINVR